MHTMSMPTERQGAQPGEPLPDREVVTRLDILNDLHADGTLQTLVIAGLMDPRVAQQREIALSYEAFRKQGLNKTSACFEVGEAMGFTWQHVYGVVRKLAEEVF